MTKHYISPKAEYYYDEENYYKNGSALTDEKDTLFITSGFSFADNHISQMIYQAVS